MRVRVFVKGLCERVFGFDAFSCVRVLIKDACVRVLITGLCIKVLIKDAFESVYQGFM